MNAGVKVILPDPTLGTYILGNKGHIGVFSFISLAL